MSATEEENLFENSGEGQDGNPEEFNVKPLSGLYKDWFLDYASYVILERAVPHIMDGLKPVQRRILHSMREMEDGRYNKVANVIGNTMKYHPHGDASIGDAMVQLGQKDLLIDTQGNWGNVYTGDSAAASRYIEARLSKFALDVVFNPKTTEWQASYDGRNKEPVTLPVKFPLLLAQGVEGIAVGLACKILPHNFNELIDACVDALRGKKFSLLPDFHTGGMADCSEYKDGERGGKIKVRARMKIVDRKTIAIEEIPFGTTTSGLIESILKVVEKNKIKIKKIEDNTAEKVEILIHLPPDASPEKTMDALYAFTNCEMSISPNTCVIENDKPHFIGVTEVLKRSAQNALDLLKLELEIKLGELDEQWHFSSLEKIFIENRIYRKIENEETWEGVLKAIDKGLKPFTGILKREVTEEDIIRLTEIKIKRISKFDSFKADEHIKSLEGEIKKVKTNLKNIVEYTIEYFKELKKKYGKGRERKTEIKIFDTIQATKVVSLNAKLYVNREEGFIGTGLKKDEFVCDCSDMDDIIVFRRDGVMTVSRITDKKFVGKDIMHIAVWRKGDTRTVYHMAYQDGTKGPFYAKRFSVTSIIRDKEYNLTRGTPNSRVIYFTVHPNGESETVTINLRPRPNMKKPAFDFEFSQMGVKGMNVMGNILSKFMISKVVQKNVGKAKPREREVYFDTLTGRINAEGRGEMVGLLTEEDMILAVMHDGTYRLLKYNADVRLEEDPVLLEKFNPRKPITAVYYESKKDAYYVKRFVIENPGEKIVKFIPEGKGNRIELVATRAVVRIQVQYDKRSTDQADEKVNLAEFVEVRNEKAVGNKLTEFKIKAINIMPPLPSDHVADKQFEPVGKAVEDQFEEEDPITEFIKKKREEELKGVPREIDEDGQTKLF